ncbi:MAG TPA: ABC transporter substrate-binding protein [Bacteroidia bacterium]|nr:ABC transporter substrate-binding protein [Bacteroidia bacterium]
MLRVQNIYRFIFIILALGSCGIEHKKDDSRSVFQYNELNGLSSLDPAAAGNFENIWPVNQIFNGLVELDDSLEVKPCIASSFSISPDGMLYTFRLRQDVYFHDDACFAEGKGRRVNARDFVYSFNRLYDSRVSSALSLLDRVEQGEKSHFQGFSALNDSTLIIQLKEPFSAFPSVLSMKYFSVIPHEAIDYYKQEFRTHPVGTGPFRFKTWEEGNKLILHKNENYFEKDAAGVMLPYLDAVTISFIKDRETAFMELLNGKFDMLSGADAFNINEVLDKEGELRDLYAARFFLQKGTYLKTDYIGILVDDNLELVQQSPLKLKAVRQAMNYAFDRDKLVKYLRNNIGEAAHAGFLPKGARSYDPVKVKGYTYDPDKVKDLLAQAGYPNGKGLPELTLHITDSYKEQAEFIQAQLAENNIRVNISVDKTSILRQAVNNSEYLLFKKSWFCDYADDENFMSLFFSRNFTPKGVNFFHFRNQRFDSLYIKALKSSDQYANRILYQRMDSLLIAEAPVIPLYYDQVVRLVSKKVSGLGINAMNLLNLKTVKKRKD